MANRLQPRLQKIEDQLRPVSGFHFIVQMPGEAYEDAEKRHLQLNPGTAIRPDDRVQVIAVQFVSGQNKA